MPDFLYESSAREKGFISICGVDEAGRGPLSGPVCAAAVILPADCEIEGLNDSKKLSEKARERLYPQIIEKAVSYCVAFAEVEEIEQYNAAATEVVRKFGFEVNDLYAVSAGLPEEAHSDAVHYYTPMGTEAFTKQVLSAIVPALGLADEVDYSEALYTDKPIGI